jgi:hypothetical protein
MRWIQGFINPRILYLLRPDVILVLLERVDGLNHYLNIRNKTIVRHNSETIVNKNLIVNTIFRHLYSSIILDHCAFICFIVPLASVNIIIMNNVQDCSTLYNNTVCQVICEGWHFTHMLKALACTKPRK